MPWQEETTIRVRPSSDGPAGSKEMDPPLGRQAFQAARRHVLALRAAFFLPNGMARRLDTFFTKAAQIGCHGNAR